MLNSSDLGTKQVRESWPVRASACSRVALTPAPTMARNGDLSQPKLPNIEKTYYQVNLAQSDKK
jgi:hypothetical protein